MVNAAFTYKGLPPPGVLCLCYLASAVSLVARGRRWGLAFAWPTSVYGLITFAYVRSGTFGARLLSKRAATTGSLPLPCVLAFLPYLLTTWSIWWLRHALVHTREDGYNLVAPGIYLGRFPLWFPCRRAHSSGAFPQESAAVVDLCAEFPALPWIVSQAEGRYICLPCLDGDLPEDAGALLRAAREVAGWGPSKPVYIHCANGRGRSCCFAVLVMMLREGGPKTAEEAIECIKKKRPQVNVARAQKALLARALELHAGDGVEPAHTLIGAPLPGESSADARARECLAAS